MRHRRLMGLVLVLMLLFSVCGCTELFRHKDTGETKTPEQWQTLPPEQQAEFVKDKVLSAEAAIILDKLTSAIERIAPVAVPAASAAFPPLTLLFTLIGSALATTGALWKRWKKPLTDSRAGLTASQAEEKQSHDIVVALVDSIEAFKPLATESWPTLEVLLKKKLGPKAEGAIRAIRGLSPRTS